MCLCVCIYIYICIFMLRLSLSVLEVVPCEPLSPEVARQQFCDGGCPLHVSCTVAVLAHPVNLGSC